MWLPLSWRGGKVSRSCRDCPLPSALCFPPGRREDGEEGIAFDTEEERQQWEDDQRVKATSLRGWTGGGGQGERCWSQGLRGALQQDWALRKVVNAVLNPGTFGEIQASQGGFCTDVASQTCLWLWVPLCAECKKPGPAACRVKSVKAVERLPCPPPGLVFIMRALVESLNSRQSSCSSSAACPRECDLPFVFISAASRPRLVHDG